MTLISFSANFLNYHCPWLLLLQWSKSKLQQTENNRPIGPKLSTRTPEKPYKIKHLRFVPELQSLSEPDQPPLGLKISQPRAYHETDTWIMLRTKTVSENFIRPGIIEEEEAIQRGQRRQRWIYPQRSFNKDFLRVFYYEFFYKVYALLPKSIQ